MAKNKSNKMTGKQIKQEKLNVTSITESQYFIEETMEMRLDSCVQKVKDLSELVIGYTPYKLNFKINSYSGITNKPSKVSSFAKAVVGIILIDGQSSFSHIGKVLGLNVDIDLAERKMLENAIKQMVNIHLLEGDDSAYHVTEQGRTFAERGEKMEPYPSKFSLWFIPGHEEYLNLQTEISEDFISDVENDIQSEQDLSIDEIMNLAEIQASHAHSPKDRFILQEAKFEIGEYKSYSLWACFIRSVRTKQVRVLIYDDNTQRILVKLSEIVNNDDVLKKQLYDSMLGNTPDVEVLDQNDAIISDEQIRAEEDLLREEEKQAPSSKATIEDVEPTSLEARLHKRALYDSISFETEIHTIFQHDNPDEIWLSSPWVGDDAFMQSRLPLIQTFLQQGGKVFISYSEPEEGLDKSKGKMVGWQSNKAIKHLAKSYPGQFFYAQFTAFHSKNVIEVKNGQSILFTGSFNVLSFHVIPAHLSHIRKEEMALAHYQVAENKYKEYKKQFAQSYLKRAEDSFHTLSETQILNYKNPSLDYFRKDEDLASLFADFDDKLDELTFSVRNKKFMRSVKQSNDAKEQEFDTHPQSISSVEENKIGQKISNTEKTRDEQITEVLALAESYIKADLVDESTVFIKLASLCYLSIGKNSQEVKLQVPWHNYLIELLSKSNVQKMVKFNLLRGREDGTTSIYVFINNTIFAFYNLTLSKKDFYYLFNRKENLPTNITPVKVRDISLIILNSQKYV